MLRADSRAAKPARATPSLRAVGAVFLVPHARRRGTGGCADTEIVPQFPPMRSFESHAKHRTFRVVRQWLRDFGSPGWDLSGLNSSIREADRPYTPCVRTSTYSILTDLTTSPFHATIARDSPAPVCLAPCNAYPAHRKAHSKRPRASGSSLSAFGAPPPNSSPTAAPRTPPISAIPFPFNSFPSRAFRSAVSPLF